ncbi:MAG: ABC transporter ATP-binding protein [Gammaproteobacteria bacterium]|jgi:lipoprotein-releasing system ATP-binding protein|nr:ABC transporter ATP-binding protein [Gammaproteobacteria bacterium]
MSNSITCKNISMNFLDGSRKTSIIKNLNLQINQGDQAAILGQSGSGKSTLLNIMGGLMKPSNGTITVNGKNFLELDSKKLSRFRGKNFGFIYQFHHLLKDFTAIENVMIPLQILGTERELAHSKAKKLLNKMGLKNRLDHRSADLSGGERQRVAIARAMIHKPKYILADEPTGNLDKSTASKVFGIMNDMIGESNSSLIMVTHDIELADQFENKLILENGKIIN